MCNCNSVRFFECVIVIVLAFCYYRLLLPLTFSLFIKSLDLKKIDVYRSLFIVYKVYHLLFTKNYHLSLQKFMVNLCLKFNLSWNLKWDTKVWMLNKVWCRNSDSCFYEFSFLAQFTFVHDVIIFKCSVKMINII